MKPLHKSGITEQAFLIAELIKRLMEDGFYGELQVKFESGRITVCRKTESIKI